MHHESTGSVANPTRIVRRAELVTYLALIAVVALLVVIASSQGAGA